MGTTEQKLRELGIEWNRVDGDNNQTIWYLDETEVWRETVEQTEQSIPKRSLKSSRLGPESLINSGVI